MGREGAHLSLTARDPGGKLRCVMFSAGERAGEARGECDLLFSPEINVWQGARQRAVDAQGHGAAGTRAGASRPSADRWGRCYFVS